MIRINCTQCKVQLEIDDAFAGGVCRCQHCGTIQTVPKRLKGNADAGGTAAGVVVTPAPAPVAPKALYQRAAKADPGISSGIGKVAAGRAVKKVARPAPTQAPPPEPADMPVVTASRQQPPASMAWLIAVAVILLLLGVVIGMLVKSHHALG